MPKGKKKQGGSSTPGKSKGQNCQRSIAKNFATKDTKAAKKDYNLYMQGMREISSMKGNIAVVEVQRERAIGSSTPTLAQ